MGRHKELPPSFTKQLFLDLNMACDEICSGCGWYYTSFRGEKSCTMMYDQFFGFKGFGNKIYCPEKISKQELDERLKTLAKGNDDEKLG